MLKLTELLEELSAIGFQDVSLQPDASLQPIERIYQLVDDKTNTNLFLSLSNGLDNVEIRDGRAAIDKLLFSGKIESLRELVDQFQGNCR